MAKPKQNHKDGDGDCNDNSERPLIDLIRTILRDFTKEIRDALAALRNKEQERHDQIMTGLETLTNSVNANVSGQAALTTAVNALIILAGTPSATDAQLLTLAGQIDSSTNSDTALTNAINTVLDAPPVVIPPTEPV